MSEKSALAEAIQIANGQTHLANKINTKQHCISTWLRRDGRISATYAIPVEAATGVPRHKLRPDLYPSEEYEIICKLQEYKRLHGFLPSLDFLNVA